MERETLLALADDTRDDTRKVLEGRPAVVIGASRRIGRGIAVELARCGVRVHAVARDHAALEKIQDWIKTRPTVTYFIEPGSPWQNGHNESFNGVLRDGCLNRWAFLSVREARLIVESWRQEYNEERLHGALNQITPAAYAAGMEQKNREAA
jgi:NAD(P)-dependent dehydrogenase (short-subunit alcohol dehydrogenase family)